MSNSARDGCKVNKVVVYDEQSHDDEDGCIISKAGTWSARRSDEG